MMQLISLDYMTEPADEPGVFEYLGQTVGTVADKIVAPYIGGPRPFPWLDRWLETLVALCLTIEDGRLPPIQDFSIYVPYAVVERNAEFYGDPAETDSAIEELCKRIILHAPVS